MEILGVADLVDRWTYTRQGVHKLIRSSDFPPPSLVINCGRTKAWRLADIEAYEAAHPETRHETLKQSKIIGYYLASMRPREGSERSEVARCAAGPTESPSGAARDVTKRRPEIDAAIAREGSKLVSTGS